MKKLLIIGGSFLVLAILKANLWSSTIMPLNEIKAGMKGKGRTVFFGNQVEEFEVTILGILENVEPKRNIILAELSGKGLEQTGVISGMSGSPVYIDDKLIGAVAYSFPYARKAIAGLTPIEEMLAATKKEKDFRPPAGRPASFKPSLSFQEILELNPGLFPELQNSIAGTDLRRLTVPLIFSGFSPFLLEKNRHLLVRLGFMPVASGGISSSAQVGKMARLKEGDPVALQLITGDLNLAAVGTVTYVDGHRILAFGHPLYNLGSVDYGLASAEILTVVPSLETSFKLAKTGPTIGRFIQDRNAGAVGEIGQLPQMIPLNLNLIEASGDYKNFRLLLVNDRILTPLLVNLALYSIILSESRAYGNLTVEFSSDLYLDNGQNIRLEDLFSGNLDKAATSFAGLVASVIYYLINNEFQEIKITRGDLRIRTTEEVRLGTLERVACNKYEVSPGERIQLKVFYRTFRDENVVEEVSFVAPQLPPGSEFQLIVGDAASMHQLELELYRNPEFSPRNLNQLIRLLNNLRKNNRIYFKVLIPKLGIFLRGEEMGSLPLTLRTMLISPRSVTSAIALNNSTLAEYQLPISHAFKGLAKIQFRIKP
ncbi:MAG: hypothetical protein N3B16_02025 [Candidatus Aminicenantes bacterium]|nr:hypothetical protein [Candidatus Aminicenantes bacterium]